MKNDLIAGRLALVAASAFASACAYINAVEQPARLDLEPRALLAQWARSYKRGTVMQVSLAVAAAGLGGASFARTRDRRWLGGAALLLALLPYTLLGVLPTNRRLLRLLATPAGDDDEAVRGGVRRWGRLHAVRTGLGIAAALTFVWASLPADGEPYGPASQ